MHSIKVNKEVAASGWKMFPCPTHNKLGDNCPFCNLSAEARKLRFEIKDETESKKYGDIEFANKAREFWIVRCIERGHEEDGVKFWLFSSSKKKDGVYDKIMNLFETRRNSNLKRGIDYSIFDLYNGQDLVITLSRTSDGKTSVQVVDEGVQSPLSDNEEQVMKWVKDEKKWTDVYTVKSQEYMEIIAGGGIPVYDKIQQKFIDKRDANKTVDDTQPETIETKVDYTRVQTTTETTNYNDSLVDNEPMLDLPF